MSTKSKRRSARRAGHENMQTSRDPQPAVKEEAAVLGAVMGALLSAITFGAVEDAPRSHRQP